MTELKDIMEKEVITEFLQLFKESPCLWDHNHPLYLNKDARKCAYEQLLGKYKMLHHDASIAIVKKKIENMRASYRRERKKIIKDLLKYGRDRMPSLWYYDHLKFLDEVLEGFGSQEMEEEEEDNDTKPKIEADMSSMFLAEDNQHLEEDTDMLPRESYFIKETPTARIDNLTESEAFGRVLGLQLHELQPTQRYIAEKLISEVIYYGRFQKLSINTRLNNV